MGYNTPSSTCIIFDEFEWEEVALTGNSCDSTIDYSRRGDTVIHGGSIYFINSSSKVCKMNLTSFLTEEIDDLRFV